MKALSPQHIMETGMSFCKAKTLLTAIELGLFTTLHNQSMTGEELTLALGLHPRANPDFFDTLLALHFLEREGNGIQARYSNTEETSYFLDRNSPAYIGGFLEMANTRIYRFWGDLTTALKTGKPQSEVKHTGRPVFEEMYSEPHRLEQFIEAMAGLSAGNFQRFAQVFDFSRYQTLCDIGGASGQLSIMVAERHRHMHCTSMDLPVVTDIANRRIAKSKLSNRVVARNIDFFNDTYPQADIITMGMILHDWNLEKKMHLIRSAYNALPKDGSFVAIEHIIDDARRENVFGLLVSLTMLIELGDGFDFTAADFDQWCRNVGFRKTEVIPLTGPASAVVAYK